jgi:hypothetical protein
MAFCGNGEFVWIVVDVRNGLWQEGAIMAVRQVKGMHKIFFWAVFYGREEPFWSIDR